MKLKALSAAVAATVAGQAFALAPSVTPDIEIYQSGASAQQETMNSLLTTFCQPGTLDTYVDTNDRYRNYFCTFNTTGVPSSLAGLDVLFSTRAAGGSGWGVVPIGKGANVQFLDLDSCAYNAANTEHTCTITTPSSALVSGECPLDGSDYSAQDADTRCRISDFGVSDVEPDLFVGNNLPAPFTSGLTTAEAAALTVSSNYGVVFGFSVSNNVRDALIANGYSVDAPAGTPVANIGAGNQVASLSKAAIRSLMSGEITNWTELDSSLTIGFNSLGFMKACRRVQGSGTQASAQIQFLDDPCHTGPKGGALAMVTAGSSNPAAGYFVVENSGSSGVERCQNRAQDTAADVDIGGITAELGGWGINAINRNQTGDTWSFVAIDGIYPSVETARTGDYDHVYEQTTQYQTSLITAGGPVADFVDLFASKFQEEAEIVASGAEGVIAIPGVSGNTYVPGSGIVGRVTRGGNSCASMQIVE